MDWVHANKHTSGASGSPGIGISLQPVHGKSDKFSEHEYFVLAPIFRQIVVVLLALVLARL